MPQIAILDAKGNPHQLEVDVTDYRAAGDAGLTLPQYLERKYTASSSAQRIEAGIQGTVFDNMCATLGVRRNGDKKFGIRPSTMAEILEPQSQPQAGVVVKDAIPASRILFPAVFLQMMEDKLLANQTMTPNAFETLIAVDENIAGERYEQPIVNYDRPAAGVSRTVAQLAPPPSMLTITTSDKAGRIPSFGIGMEVSDQALKATTIDFVALSLGRQVEIERNTRANAYILALLNGDLDTGDASLSSLSLSHTSASYDSAATGGVMTQKAWQAYLMNNAVTRTISHIITDINTALAIENRSGRPTTYSDDPKSPRINTLMQVINPLWPDQVKAFLTVDPAWPAGTIMGLDSRYAIRRIRNINATYQAIEAYVMRRSTQMRFDFGETVHRLYNEAFDVMTLS